MPKRGVSYCNQTNKCIEVRLGSVLFAFVSPCFYVTPCFLKRRAAALDFQINLMPAKA
jgi:hypothetical protein